MPSTRQKYRVKIVEFRHLWLSIEYFIGNLHLSLFAEAQELREFISDIDSQSNPLHAVLHESYRRAKCRTLNSSIDPFIVMDVLGENLFHQKNRDNVDVTLVDLIERTGLYISRKFISDHHEQSTKKTIPTSIEESKLQKNKSAKIISLELFQKH